MTPPGVPAWRCWGLAATPPGLLCSCLDPFPPWEIIQWPAPDPGPARCAFHGHPAPDDGCRCGWRGQPGLDELVWWLADVKHVVPHVIGGVELSGTVVTGDSAHPEIPGVLRAQRVTVTGPLITAPGLTRPGLDWLAARYGVPVRPSSARHWRGWVRAVPADVADNWPDFAGRHDKVPQVREVTHRGTGAANAQLSGRAAGPVRAAPYLADHDQAMQQMRRGQTADRVQP